MLLLQACFLAIISAGSILGATKHTKPQQVPLDFLGEQVEELTRERPLLFNPDDGIHFRRDFEHQHGYRGERLIAKLGGGATPLSIYDASLIKQTTSSYSLSEASPTTAVPVKTTSTSTVQTPREIASPIKAVLASIKPARGYVRKERLDENKEPTQASVKRKYQDVRVKKERKNYLKSSRVSKKSSVTTESTPADETSSLTKSSIAISPRTPRKSAVALADDTAYEEEQVQRRLYRAIWNHGLRGLSEGEADSISDNLRNLENFAQPNFNNLNIAQQLSGAIELSRQSNFQFQSPAPVFEDANNVQSSQDAQILHALAAGAAAENQLSGQDQGNQGPPIELGEPSLPQYAGPGQPSLLVTSYSYSEVVRPPSFADAQPQPQAPSGGELSNPANDANNFNLAGDGQNTGNEQQNFANFDDPIAGARR